LVPDKEVLCTVLLVGPHCATTCNGYFAYRLI
jgi:hypothetical protein